MNAIIPGTVIIHTHTALSILAFGLAFVVSLCNGLESLNDTIQRYPFRSVFQVLIAITAGPRFLYTGLWYLLTAGQYTENYRLDSIPTLAFAVGILRTLALGGVVYTTDQDDHEWHDVYVAVYALTTVAWIASQLVFVHTKRREHTARLYALTFIPLAYFLVQDRLHHSAIARTWYALFEWVLTFLDIYFDSLAEREFTGLRLDLVGSRAEPSEKEYSA